MGISDYASKVIGDKRRWRDYKTRTRRLPESYRVAVEGIERYLLHVGGIMDAGNAASLFEDVADLFERAAADETPIREIVGDDPVEFVDSLVRNYDQGGYVAREQARLVSSIDRAVAMGSGSPDGSG